MEPISSPTSRRDLFKKTAATAIAVSPMGAVAGMVAEASTGSFIDLLREPDVIRVWGKDDEIALSKKGGVWQGNGVDIRYSGGDLTLRADVGVSRIQVRWRGDMAAIQRVLGDHWERSYADLAWRGLEARRPMPWYFLATDGKRTHGYGVQTGPGAMCFWLADNEGISLWADVRSGSIPVRLGDRALSVCKVVCREGKRGESAFGAAQAFCRQMCPNPRLADHSIYGTNDWNYTYGNNSAAFIEDSSAGISELSSSRENRPYSVIDDGWSQGGLGHGPWFGNSRFGDMDRLAERLKGVGVRPGLWFRALTSLPGQPDSWKLKDGKGYLDPTIPEVRSHVVEHMRRFAGWGYEMVKHDYTSFDIFGQFGMSMGASVPRGEWRFHDDTKTSAEVVLDLYRAIREGAGKMHLIGCNTFSHLAAGIHEAQRIGDDTSGHSWQRTRRMGINTLAFRAAQHGTFYSVDPDIMAITDFIPWSLNEQWLRLVAGSGTSLFVAFNRQRLETNQKAALKQALTLAAKPWPVGEPLDWMTTDCPRRWRLGGKVVEFDWMGPNGDSPFQD